MKGLMTRKPISNTSAATSSTNKINTPNSLQNTILKSEINISTSSKKISNIYFRPDFNVLIYFR